MYLIYTYVYLLNKIDYKKHTVKVIKYKEK